MSATKQCMPEVVDLVEHLRTTGTGPNKLKKLLEIGSQVETLDSFLDRASRVVPTGTMQKINDYWGAKKDAPKDKKTK